MAFVAKTAYVTVEDSDIYFQGKLDTVGWLFLDRTTKQKALIEASTILDLFNYVDIKKDNTQEHEFPRNIIYDNIKYDIDNVPLDIKYAACELAAALTNDFDRNLMIESLGIKSDTFASVKTEYDRTSISQHSAAGVPPIVWQFISPFIRDSRSVMMSRVS